MIYQTSHQIVGYISSVKMCNLKTENNFYFQQVSIDKTWSVKTSRKYVVRYSMMLDKVGCWIRNNRICASFTVPPVGMWL